MARITSDKAAALIGNKFDMILIAAARARDISRGSKPMVKSENGPLVTALREIEHGLITKDDFNKYAKRK